MSAKAERPPLPPGGDDLTTDEACDYLKVSRATLYVRGRRFQVRRVHHGRAVRWPRAELDRMRQLSMRQLR